MADYKCLLLGLIALTSLASFTETRPLSEDELGMVIGPHEIVTPLTDDDLGVVIGPHEAPALAEEETTPSCDEKVTLKRSNFPSDFIFGTATSAFQIEGTKNGLGRGLTTWDEFTHRFAGKVSDQSDADIGVDFYNRYKEDVQLMKNLNTNGFRFSISWTRILPRGRKSKGVNEEGIRFYNDLIDELIENGIEPAATLFHWETPLFLEEEYGGFLNKAIVEDFREYAKICFDRFGDRVKNWATFNEPGVYSVAGYGSGKKAPGRCSTWVNSTCDDGNSGTEPYDVTHNQLLAHVAAVEEFRACDKCQGGKIGIVLVCHWYEAHNRISRDDRRAVQRMLDYHLGWYLDPLTYGDYPSTIKKNVRSRLPVFSNEESQKLKRSLDFVGLNYYGKFFVTDLKDVNSSQISYGNDHAVDRKTQKLGSKKPLEVSPMGIVPSAEGFRKLLKYIKDRYQNPEIYVMENGSEEFDNGSMTPEKALNDISRKKFLQSHLLNLQEAIRQDEVRVKGYFVWSLMDNFEWERGYRMRFGLYYVDYDNGLTRHIKESGKWFKRFLAGKKSRGATGSRTDKLSKHSTTQTKGIDETGSYAIRPITANVSEQYYQFESSDVATHDYHGSYEVAAAAAEQMADAFEEFVSCLTDLVTLANIFTPDMACPYEHLRYTSDMI